MDRELLEKAGTAVLPPEIPYAVGMFVARGWGDSMLPRIPDGWWLYFHPKVVGTRRDRLVLVEDQNKMSGDRYTLKKFRSSKVFAPDGTWTHDKVVLVSLNRAHPDIPLNENRQYQIRGWYVDCTRDIERVEPFQYPEPWEE
jgi:phage repressor protein C with HTH and peptisase S24 domain